MKLECQVYRSYVPLGCDVNNEKNLPLVDAEVDVLAACILHAKDNSFNTVVLLHNSPKRLLEIRRNEIPVSEFRRFSSLNPTDRQRNSHEDPPEQAKRKLGTPRASPESGAGRAGDLAACEQNTETEGDGRESGDDLDGEVVDGGGGRRGGHGEVPRAS